MTEVSTGIPAPESAAKLVYFYKIVCNDLDIAECYVGSTHNFAVRKLSHKSKCHNPNSGRYHIKLYQFIRGHGGWDNWSMVVIDNVLCDDGHDARIQERAYASQQHATLNTCVPGRTDRESKAHHFREHIEAIYEKRKYKFECVCGGRYTLSNKSVHEKTNRHIKSLETV